MELLRTLAHAVCANCGAVIDQTSGEWSGVRWHHQQNGLAQCPGAPIATPMPGSVVVEPPGRDDT